VDYSTMVSNLYIKRCGPVGVGSGSLCGAITAETT
jgi:hypothetical protein